MGLTCVVMQLILKDRDFVPQTVTMFLIKPDIHDLDKVQPAPVDESLTPAPWQRSRPVRRGQSSAETSMDEELAG
jgi:hypothetical protein